MDKRDAAGILAQTKWLKDRIKEWEESAKAVLLQELDEGEKTTAVSPSHNKLGFVTKAKGKRGMVINNEAGFLAWVQMRYPTEVEQSVRPAFIKLCQEKVVKLGGLPDANGELCPHVSLSQGEPYTFVTLDEFAGALIGQEIMQRKLMDVITPASELPSPPTHTPAEDHPGFDDDMGDIDPEPELDDEMGPPNWPESSTFEQSDSVRQRRG